MRFWFTLNKANKCIADCKELNKICEAITNSDDKLEKIDNFDLMSLFLIYESRKGNLSFVQKKNFQFGRFLISKDDTSQPHSIFDLIDIIRLGN